MIVGGCHLSYRFGEEDVILASCVLYLDIINLFWYILKLFGNRE
jgi:FtsH-binding integral membrane protein